MLKYNFEILSPHPEITRIHTEHNHPYTKTAHDKAFEIWLSQVNKKEPVDIVVTQITRQTYAGKEYLVWDADLVGKDRKGNELRFYHRFGTYEKPKFRKDIDERTDEIKSIEVAGYTTVYEHEFKQDLLDDLLQCSVENVSLVVSSSGKSYTVEDMYDFREYAKEDLIVANKTGKKVKAVIAAAAKTK